LSLLLSSPLKAASQSEQATLVAKIEEQIRKVEKLTPEELDKALKILEIEDPSITKAVAHYRSLTKEKEAALTLLKKAHSSLLDNTRSTLAIEKRQLDASKVSK
jgi:plasmid rolling circle replication initiator protein Rep